MVTNNNLINSADLSGKVAFDANGLNNLKQAARENSPEAIKEVAKQFEAIFMNMMLKSMREASPQDSPFDNEQSRTFTTMLDQQLTTNLSSKGLGLADILARQLSKGGYTADNAMEQAVTDKTTSPDTHSNLRPDLTGNPFLNNIANTLKQNNAGTQPSALNGSATYFKNRMASHAETASQSTGIPAHLMLGQAALESGWGKREIKAADGTPSNNLFGIKATGNWNGKVVEATTTEYVHGIKQKRIEKFRAYDSYADSFKDFANLMQNNPRYENVMENLHSPHGYAQAMQKAGYATDPDYATKLASVIQKISPSL